MASVFIKPERLAATALALLQRDIIIPRTITNFSAADFVGAANDAVKVPIRARVAARALALRATSRTLTTDDLIESSVSVALTNIVYSAVPLTDEMETLDIDNFSERVLAPQVRGVSEALEVYAYNCIANANYNVSNYVEWDTKTTGAFKAVVRAGKILNQGNVPQDGRVLLVGPGAYEAILTDDKLEPGVGASGLGESALRNAVIGRLANFTVVTSNLLNDDEMYAYHRSAFAFANVAPAVPKGAASGSSMSDNGFAMRWVGDYDALNLTDRSVVTSFVGTKSIEDGAGTTQVRAVRVVLDYAS